METEVITESFAETRSGAGLLSRSAAEALPTPELNRLGEGAGLDKQFEMLLEKAALIAGAMRAFRELGEIAREQPQKPARRRARA